MSLYHNEDVLVGKVLTGLRIAKDRQAIMFNTPEGDIVAHADADCCSYTWVEHIELPALGFPAKVSAVEELSMPDVEPPNGEHGGDSYDVVAFYGLKITTDKGEIVIDYRNDSNGYYGGWLVFPGSDFYGGVFGQQVSEEEWVDVQLSA